MLAAAENAGVVVSRDCNGHSLLWLAHKYREKVFAAKWHELVLLIRSSPNSRLTFKRIASLATDIHSRNGHSTIAEYLRAAEAENVVKLGKFAGNGTEYAILTGPRLVNPALQTSTDVCSVKMEALPEKSALLVGQSQNLNHLQQSEHLPWFTTGLTTSIGQIQDFTPLKNENSLPAWPHPSMKSSNDSKEWDPTRKLVQESIGPKLLLPTQESQPYSIWQPQELGLKVTENLFSTQSSLDTLHDALIPQVAITNYKFNHPFDDLNSLNLYHDIQSTNSTQVHKTDKMFIPLVKVLTESASDFMLLSALGGYNLKDVYIQYGYSKLKEYLEDAERAGLVSLGGGERVLGSEYVSLIRAELQHKIPNSTYQIPPGLGYDSKHAITKPYSPSSGPISPSHLFTDVKDGEIVSFTEIVNLIRRCPGRSLPFCRIGESDLTRGIHRKYGFTTLKEYLLVAESTGILKIQKNPSLYNGADYVQLVSRNQSSELNTQSKFWTETAPLQLEPPTTIVNIWFLTQVSKVEPDNLDRKHTVIECNVPEGLQEFGENDSLLGHTIEVARNSSRDYFVGLSIIAFCIASFGILFVAICYIM